MRYKKQKVSEFLFESNAIEGVYDEDSYDQAWHAWEFLVEQKKLTIGVVLKTHKILMLHQNLLPSDKGYFRNIMVYIGGSPAINALHIPERMEQWVLNVNDLIVNGKKESRILRERVVKEHHVQYEHIHPFIDGNGRTGRLFMNWERLRLGLPILIIHEGEEQQEYYKWFQDTSD